VWAQVHRSPKANPSARDTTALVARRQGADGGWREAHGHHHGQRSGIPLARVPGLRPKARGRTGLQPRWPPQTNGAIERVPRTILRECWRPTFATSLVPHYTALHRYPAAYLGYYYDERAHAGCLANGRTPLAAYWVEPGSQPEVNPMSEREPTQVNNLDRYGFPPLPWSRAQDALAGGSPSPAVTFFLGTVGPDGKPTAAGPGRLLAVG